MDRSRVRQAALPVAYIALIGAIAAFLHSGIQGEHGLGAYREAQAEQWRLHAELEDLRREHAELGNLVHRLGNETLDLDLLDERARAVLGLVREDELIVR